ncbi:MAG: 50S ribosomal protein L18 [Candidatus Margulisiibacteriota bacterium]
MRKRKIFGTKERPRLSVFRSIRHVHAQIINDEEGKTLAAASSLKLAKAGKMEIAKQVGKMLAEIAKKAGITKVVFDRGTFRYRGRIQVLADAAREGGLIF